MLSALLLNVGPDSACEICWNAQAWPASTLGAACILEHSCMVWLLTCLHPSCRRMNAVRLGQSGSHMRHGATSETPDLASTATHVASRRRRHRRNASFGSMGYPAALNAHPSSRHPGDRGPLVAAEATAEDNAPESSAASRSKPGSSLDPEESQPVQAEPPRQADVVHAGAAAQPAQHDSSRVSVERGERVGPRDSAATELPEEWVTALHSLDSSEATSLPINGTSEACALSTSSGSRPASDRQARPCEGKSSLPRSPSDLKHRYFCLYDIPSRMGSGALQELVVVSGTCNAFPIPYALTLASST